MILNNKEEARTHNTGIAKMQADGTCLSTFCFSIWLQLAGADGILLPPLRQALLVGHHFMGALNL